MKNCANCLCFDCSLNDRRNRVKCDFCRKCKDNEILNGIKECTVCNNPELYINSQL